MMECQSSYRIFIIEDDPIMAECLARACSVKMSKPETRFQAEVVIFHDAIRAMAALEDGLPNLILLDVLLNGPDGFTFLNELISYSDTAAIPVILITSLDLSSNELAHYGVRRVISKETMTPQEIQRAVRQVLATPENTQDKFPTSLQAHSRVAHAQEISTQVAQEVLV